MCDTFKLFRVGVDIEPVQLGSIWLIKITSWLSSVCYINELEFWIGSARLLAELAC